MSTSIAGCQAPTSRVPASLVTSTPAPESAQSVLRATGWSVRGRLSRASSRGCERGSSAGCRYLGDAYENGWGTDIDLGKARAAYGKQCALDSTRCQGISEPCSVDTSGCEAKEWVRSRPTADYRWWRAGNNRTCPVHDVAMLEDRVPIVHGLGSGFGHSLDEKEGAPFA